MALQLAPEEPEAGPWRTEPLTVLVQALTQRMAGRIVSGRSMIVAIDGRSNNGKTSLAARIGEAVPGSVVIHTDDIAWAHSRFGWDDLLIDGILVPVHRGEAVSYRPPRWAEHGREGSIDVPAGCPLLIVEGDGAGRREVAHVIDALIWVQADEGEAERRRLARDQDPDVLDMANRPLGGRVAFGPRRVDGRGDTVQRCPAGLGTGRCHRVRYPGDPVRSEHRSRRRAAPTPRG